MTGKRTTSSRRRSLLGVLLLWGGRQMVRRARRRTMRAVTARNLLPLLRRAGSAPVAKGALIALASIAAVMAARGGVAQVMEAERGQSVVTPDFDVFSDDEE